MFIVLGSTKEAASAIEFLSNPTAFGATIAAVVAILTFAFNWRTALQGQADARQNQSDQQLYEALRRFGDESAALRVSAAGLVAFCGAASFRRGATRENFITAVSQLIDGLRLEIDVRVRQAIVGALKILATLDPEYVVQVLYQSNLTLQRDFIEALASECVAQNAESPGECVRLAAQLAKVLGIDASVILSFLADRPPWTSTRFFDEFEQAFAIARAAREAAAPGVPVNLQVAFGRLEANATALASAIQIGTRHDAFLKTYAFKVRYVLTHPLSIGLLFRTGATPSVRSRLYLPGVYLAEQNLGHHSDLRSAILSEAKLQKASLYTADLRNADLRLSHLEGASLAGARLDNAQLYGAHIDASDVGPGLVEDGISYFGVGNWWTANFYSEGNHSSKTLENDRENRLDEKLVAVLTTEGLGVARPDYRTSHPSVRLALTRNQEAQQTTV